MDRHIRYTDRLIDRSIYLSIGRNSYISLYSNMEMGIERDINM